MNIIQIGCNDCTDEAYKFITENKNNVEKFLVIDALPKCVEIARGTYSFLGNKLNALNCAVGVENSIANFYFPSVDDANGQSSLSEAHLFRHGHSAIGSMTVPILDVNNVFKWFNKEVDWLFLDAEGLDALMLLHLDFEKYKPKNIYYEFAHSDGPFILGANHKNLMDKFYRFNYQLTRTEGNITAKLIN